MSGVAGKHHQYWYDSDEDIHSLASDIEQALTIFDDDHRTVRIPDCDVFLKALVGYIIGRFDIKALDYVFAFYKADIARFRNET